MKHLMRIVYGFLFLLCLSVTVLSLIGFGHWLLELVPALQVMMKYHTEIICGIVLLYVCGYMVDSFIEKENDYYG